MTGKPRDRAQMLGLSIADAYAAEDAKPGYQLFRCACRTRYIEQEREQFTVRCKTCGVRDRILPVLSFDPPADAQVRASVPEREV